MKDRRANTDRIATTGRALEFRSLVEGSPDGMLVVDVEGRVLLANASAAALLGRPLPDLVGCAFGYPAVTADPVELVIGPADTEPRIAELRAAEIEWGGSPALVVNLRDVTERQRQAQRIAELNSTLRTLLEIEEIILREKDPRALLDAACRVLVRERSYVAASVVLQDGREGRVRLTEASVDGHDASFSVAMGDGALPACCEAAREHPGEVVYWRPPVDGCRHCDAVTGCERNTRLVTTIHHRDQVFGFLTLVLSVGHREDAEEPTLIQRLADDLGYALHALRTESDHRRAADELRQSQTRFAQLFENSVDAIVIAGADGRYLEVNPSACRMFGLSRQQMLSMSVSDLQVPEGESSAGERFEAYVPHGTQAGRFCFVRPDGEVRVTEYSAFALDSGGYVSILRDVTDRESLAEQLRQAQKMEAVGQLAGGIAHDFNNLLTAIISYSAFVRDDLPFDDPRREDLGEVLGAADRAARLTRKLLAFSREEPYSPRVVDLNAIVVDMQRLLARTLGEDVRIDLRLEDDLWQVALDPGQFEHVLMNLAVNARDAMPGGGTLTLGTRNQPADDEQGAASVVLWVQDTGGGMGEDVRARLFEPFFTTKDVGAGTGLGLSIVYGLVTQAGGSIEVQSEPGRGSCFTIRLPRAAGSPTQSALPPSSAPPPRGTETILIVEDDAGVRRVAARILKQHGYRVLESADGLAASELFATRGDDVDLVLTDVVMPGMSGPDVADLLRERRPDLRVLFMSGHILRERAGRAAELAADATLLRKPFTEHALITRVREVLDRD